MSPTDAKKAPSTGEGANRVRVDQDPRTGSARLQSGHAAAALVAVQNPFQPGGQDRDRSVVVNGGVSPEALCLRGMGPDHEAGAQDASHEPAERMDRGHLLGVAHVLGDHPRDAPVECGAGRALPLKGFLRPTSRQGLRPSTTVSRSP